MSVSTANKTQASPSPTRMPRRRRFLAALLAVLSFALFVLGVRLVVGLLSSFYTVLPWGPFWFGVNEWLERPPALYTPAHSFRAGDSLQVYYNGGGVGWHLALYRADLAPDWALEHALVSLIDVPFRKQATDHSPWERGAGWRDPLLLPLPMGLSGGLYTLVLLPPSGQVPTASQVILVRGGPETNHTPNADTTRRIAWVLSTNTWASYNPWGGRSGYSDDGPHSLSFSRPNPLANPLVLPHPAWANAWSQSVAKDYQLAELLHELQLPYDAFADRDIHVDSTLLDGYGVLIVSTHSEYWSRPMLQSVSRFLARGGTLLCLSGNTAFWPAAFDTATGNLLVDRRVNNRWWTLDSQAVAFWGLHTDEATMHSYAPYRWEASNHWERLPPDLAQGFRQLVQRAPDSLLGSGGSSCWDWTVSYATPWAQLQLLLRPFRLGMPSGLEIERTTPLTPTNWIPIATGLNPAQLGLADVWPDESLAWDTSGGAQMGMYRHPGGGWVFNAGSIAFTGAIGLSPDITELCTRLLLWAAGLPAIEAGGARDLPPR